MNARVLVRAAHPPHTPNRFTSLAFPTPQRQVPVVTLAIPTKPEIHSIATPALHETKFPTRAHFTGNL